MQFRASQLAGRPLLQLVGFELSARTAGRLREAVQSSVSPYLNPSQVTPRIVGPCVLAQSRTNRGTQRELGERAQVGTGFNY